MFVEIYGTKNCKYCGMAKKLAEEYEHEVSYTDVSDPEEKANMNLRLGFQARSVPQIFVDGRYLMQGFNQLKDLILAKG